MSMKEAVLAALKELILPELQFLKQEQAEIKTTLVLTNKRLDDVNIHLVDQSRRIDAVREELTGRIDTLREELHGRIDTLREDLSARIDAVREELTARIDAVREELSARLDDTNKRLDRLYEIIVRRDEHQQLALRLDRLENEVAELRRRLAA